MVWLLADSVWCQFEFARKYLPQFLVFVCARLPALELCSELIHFFDIVLETPPYARWVRTSALQDVLRLFDGMFGWLEVQLAFMDTTKKVS